MNEKEFFLKKRVEVTEKYRTSSQKAKRKEEREEVAKEGW